MAALCQPTRALAVATAQPPPLRRRVVRCAARAESAPAADARARVAAASFAAAVVLAGALSAPLPALAIPQTSACATASCDDNDYSKRDLRKEFYTKARACLLAHRAGALARSPARVRGQGSLKRANFSGSNLAGVTLFGAVRAAAAHARSLARAADAPPRPRAPRCQDLSGASFVGAVRRGPDCRCHADEADGARAPRRRI